MKPSIQELVELSKQHPDYMSELWSVFQNDCMVWAKKVQKAPEDLLDLYNEAYVILQRAVTAYDLDRGIDFERYFRKALKYEGQHYRKKYDHRAKHEYHLPGTNQDGDLYDGLVDERVHIEEEIMQQATKEQLYQVLETLKEDEKYILEAFYLRHESIEKISLYLGVSCDAVDSKKRRTLKKLREKCDGLYF